MIRREFNTIAWMVRGTNLCQVRTIHLTKSLKNQEKSKTDQKGTLPDHSETIIDFEAVRKIQSKRITPSQKRKQAAELARTSISDIFDFVSSQSPEDVNYKEPVDVNAIINSKQPGNAFCRLSFNQQEQIVETLDPYRYEEWPRVDPNVKRLLYVVAYGNWGPRLSFVNPVGGSLKGKSVEINNQSYIPEDVPFSVPSQIKTTQPSASTKVTKLAPINLMFATKERRDQYNKNVKSLDPVSQTVVILGFLVSGLAIIKDKFFSEETDESSPSGEIIDSMECIAEAPETVKENFPSADLQKPAIFQGKKWYYLWLK